MILCICVTACHQRSHTIKDRVIFLNMFDLHKWKEKKSPSKNIFLPKSNKLSFTYYLSVFSVYTSIPDPRIKPSRPVMKLSRMKWKGMKIDKIELKINWQTRKTRLVLLFRLYISRIKVMYICTYYSLFNGFFAIQGIYFSFIK